MTKITKKDATPTKLSPVEWKYAAFQALWTTYLHLRAWGLPEYEELTLADMKYFRELIAKGREARLDKIDAEATAEISRLQSEVEAVAIENNTAQKAMYAAEDSARRLLLLHDEGLLRAEDAPKEVRYLIERRAAEEKSRLADSARAAAVDERDRCLAAVGNLEDRLANFSITLTSQRVESLLKNRLKEAKRQLGEAEDRLKQAQANADAARKAIP